MYLSFVIPAYNEAERIDASLQKALAYFAERPYSSEVIVVDDGSRDETCQRVAAYEGDRIRLVRQPRNMGKGAAVRRGMLEARGEFRIFSDADFSTPIHETERVLAALQEYNVAIGSRGLDESFIKEHQPWYRETMGKAFNLMVQAVAVPGIHDTQCGFKGFQGEVAEQIFSRAKISGFSFDVEALYLARRLGYSIRELSVEWYNDERSTLNPVSDSIKMFIELLKIRSLHRDFVGL